MRVSAIVAMTRDRLIGTATGLPWQLPADLKRFRTLTLGKPVLLGRKTIEMIGKPLPGRGNIVVTRQADWRMPGCTIVADVPTALSLAEEYLREHRGDEAMLAGGAELYAAAWPWVSRVYLTWVEGTFAGTTYFPELDFAWPVTHREAHAADERNAVAHTFEVRERR